MKNYTATGWREFCELAAGARAYLILLAIGGAAALSIAVWQVPYASLTELALLAIAAALASMLKIQLTFRDASFSLACVFVYITLLTLGLPAMVVVAAITGVTANLKPLEPWYRVVFNASALAATAFLAGSVYLGLGGNTVALSLDRNLLPLVLSTFIYYLINTYSVAIAIGLATRQPARKVWNEHMMWTAPAYFAGTGLAVPAAIAVQSVAPALALLLLPVAMLVYQSYKRYMDTVDTQIKAMEAGERRLRDVFVKTVEAMAKAIDAKDPHSHNGRVPRLKLYAVEIARELGFDEQALEGIRTGAVLHDIGKIGIADSILFKPGPLTPDEYAQMKRHPELGAKILASIDFPWPIIPMVRWHQERFDGSGYPAGLRGDEIPIEARIIAVADVFDALTSNRLYRIAMTPEEAKRYIVNGAGTQFDPMVVAAFVRVFEPMELVFGDGEAKWHSAFPGSLDAVSGRPSAAAPASRAPAPTPAP